MNKILFLFLRIVRRLQRTWRSLRGRSEEDIHAERIVSGKAWDEFCDELKAAGAVLHLPGTPSDPFQQAEGLRYLTRLIRGGLEAFIEYGDPEFPVFRRTVHETVKMGADNPDNYYFNAQIIGSQRYRITGKRNTVHYIGFYTQNGNYGTTGGLAPCDSLDHTELVTNEDGSFEIILGKQKEGQNWLKLEDETSLVMVRQTFLERQKEVPAEIFIEMLDSDGLPKPLTPKRVDEGLKTASLFVGGASFLFARWAHNFQKHTNRLPEFDAAISNAAGGDSAIIYYHSHWKLQPGEALLIEAKPPLCDSWNFQLNNYWMESLDYRYFTICINKAGAVYEPDGKVRVIVSHDDPGMANWIQTCGHTEGTMCWRWYRPGPGEKAVEPECRVVKIQTEGIRRKYQNTNEFQPDHPSKAL